MTILAEPFAATIPANRESTVEGIPLRPGDPTAVGEWRLASRLGRGGMADVFYAIDPGGRTAAVKILRAGPHAPDVRLIDFGTSHHVGEYFGAEGTVQCTRGWAAPEQLSLTAATPAADIFGWGCLLAHAAGGVHPFASTSDEEWIMRIRSAEPDLFGVPPDLAEVVRWAVVRDPSSRPTAGDLSDICAAYLRPRRR